MNRTIAAASLIAVATATAANAATIAVWNFNDGTSTVQATLTTQLLSVDRESAVGTPTLASSLTPTANTGVTNNADSGDSAGKDLTVTSPGSSSTGTLTFSINLTGYQAPSVSYAIQRSTAGYQTQTWAYSTNGGTTFTSVTPDVSAPTSYATRSVDFSSIAALTNNPNAQFRVTMSGATSTGNNRYDNVVFAGTVFTNTAPVVTDPAPVAVVFGPTVTDGAPFSATVSATDVNLTDTLALAVGTLPAGISGIAVTGGGTSPQSFVVTGTVDYSLNGTTVLIPYTVSDGQGGTTPGTITLVITPEPTTLTALAGVGTLLLRRRK